MNFCGIHCSGEPSHAGQSYPHVVPTSRPSPFARFYDLESKLSPSLGAHRCIQRLTTSAKRSPASRKGRENFPTLEPAVGRISGAKCLVPGAYTDRLREHVDGSEATSHLQIYFSCFKTLSPPLLFSGRSSGCSRRCFSGGSSLVLLGRVPTVFGTDLHQFFLRVTSPLPILPDDHACACRLGLII